MSRLFHPPIDVKAFLEETFDDSEYWRKSAAGRTYARGRHGGFDMQHRAHPDSLYAVADGVIDHKSFGPSYGLQMTLVVPNSSGFGWFYAHCATRVPDGTKVRAGQRIGRMGTTGGVAKHLHFEGRTDWRDWATDQSIGGDLRDLQRKIKAGEKPWLEDDEMTPAQMQELKDYIAKEVESKMEWNLAAIVKAILGRHVPSGYGGDMPDMYKRVCKEAIAEAAAREKQQHGG